MKGSNRVVLNTPQSLVLNSRENTMSFDDFRKIGNWIYGVKKFLYVVLVGLGYWAYLYFQEVFHLDLLPNFVLFSCILCFIFLIYCLSSKESNYTENYLILFGNFVTGIAIYFLKKLFLLLLDDPCGIRGKILFLFFIFSFDAIIAYTYSKILHNRREKNNSDML